MPVRFWPRAPGGMPEWPNGMVSKTIGSNPFASSNLAPTAHYFRVGDDVRYHSLLNRDCQIPSPPQNYLAIVRPQTFSAPFLFKTLAASFMVEPVVRMSSKRISEA